MNGRRALQAAAVLLATAGVASAQVAGDDGRIALGGGRSYRRAMRRSVSRRGGAAVFAVVADEVLGFVPAPGVVRAYCAFGARLAAMYIEGVRVSDDNGASWPVISTGDMNGVRSLACGTDGFAATVTQSAVWTTNDSGSSWRQLWSESGVSFLDVAIAGRAVVVSDNSAGVRVVSAAGGGTRTIIEDGYALGFARLTQQRDAVLVTSGDGAHEWRVDEAGSVEPLR